MGGLVTVPAVHRMTWQTGIDLSSRTLAAVHCQKALAALGPGQEELTLYYMADGSPDPEGEFKAIIVTMRWARMAAADVSPITMALGKARQWPGFEPRAQAGSTGTVFGGVFFPDPPGQSVM